MSDSKNAEILRAVYPERNTEILRFAQDDSEWAQNDTADEFLRSLFSPGARGARSTGMIRTAL